MQMPRSQAGVSLVELMVGLTIGLIITAGAMTVLFSNQKLILSKDKMDRAQENFRFASTTISRVVRQATSFGIPSDNNELIVHFDSSQRDCLGQTNYSSVNTFKVDADNKLLCILDLNDGTRQTITLAEDISDVNFTYGIQNGASANSLVYRPFFIGGDGTITNPSVSNVWGTVTSVLTKMSVVDGEAKKPTVDFISTSHLLAMTQLASSGGTSKVNPPSSGGGSSTPEPDDGDDDTDDPNDTGDGSDNPPDDGNGGDETCSNSMLANISLTANGTTHPWSGGNFVAGKAATVTLTVNNSVNRTGWTIDSDKDSSPPESLNLTHSFSLPNGNNKQMKLTLRCGTQVTSESITIYSN
ncbi:hypothetical protein Q674_04915 [Acinetobacter sp. COS3]|nr:hypothetical protein Q674_04915 [Acinetobacter sp. COS3]